MSLDWSLFKDRYQDIIPDFDLFLKKLEEPLPIGLREAVFHQVPYKLEEKLIREKEEFNKPFDDLPFYEVFGERKRWGGDIDHHLGLYFMQALSSLLPVLALNPKKGDVVLDMCAAPGGKSGFLAEKMENSGKLVCCEPDLNRRRVLKANLSRLGVYNCFSFPGKGQDLPFPSGSFDKVLLDGPCSSEGTFRHEVLKGKKRREINYMTYNEAFRKKLHIEQAELLDKAYDLLRPGGVLIYSTCTYDPDENEGAINSFLKRHPDCSLKDLEFSREIDEKLCPGLTRYSTSFDSSLALTRRVYPHLFNSIGFYVAKIVK